MSEHPQEPEDTHSKAVSQEGLDAPQPRRTITFDLVEPNSEEHGSEIRAITSNDQVMKWVADGRTWNRNKFQKFFGYCAEERGQDDAVRTNYYHAIVTEGVCTGVVGIHAVTYDRTLGNKPVLTIFMSPEVGGRGVGTRVIETALHDYWARHPDRPVYVDVRTDNFPMLRVAEKMGLTRVGSPRIGGKHYRRFEAAPERR